MRLTCPGCRKQLNVPASVAGMKVRCSGCKKVLAVPRRLPAGEADPAPPPGPRGAPVPDMRGAACRTPALRALPANAFSRHPGYVCAACGATLRPPGSTVPYVLVIVLGGVVVLLGVVLAIVFVVATEFRAGRALIAPVSLVGVGAAAATWAFRQLRLPTPLDAPAGTAARQWLWLLLVLAGLALPFLLVGCLLVAVLYYLQEVM